MQLFARIGELLNDLLKLLTSEPKSRKEPVNKRLFVAVK